MDVRRLIPSTDNIRARLTEATINMAPYNTSTAQLAQINIALDHLMDVKTKLEADVAINKIRTGS